MEDTTAPDPVSEEIHTPEPEPVAQPTREEVIVAIEEQIVYLSSLSTETEYEADGLTTALDTLTLDLEFLKAT